MRLVKQPKALPFTVDPANRGIKAVKAALREEFKARRALISPDLRDTTRWKVTNHLRTLLAGMDGVVALYYPLGAEIDLRPLAAELWRAGMNVALPRVVERGHALRFNIWTPDGATEPDALGLPTATGPEVWPTTMVIPMLGYSKTGHRLGYGGGYYDRTLKTAPIPTLSIGVCYTELEVDDFPAEYHDQRLEYVVTGREVIRCC